MANVHVTVEVPEESLQDFLAQIRVLPTRDGGEFTTAVVGTPSKMAEWTTEIVVCWKSLEPEPFDDAQYKAEAFADALHTWLSEYRGPGMTMLASEEIELEEFE